MHARSTARAAHRVAQLRLDERVEDDGGTAARPAHGELEILHRLDARVAHLLERLVGELRLERMNEPRGRLSGGVRHDVELHGRCDGHAAIVTTA